MDLKFQVLDDPFSYSCRCDAFRYNKTLLGDHLGKFPAPLLMNTVHFSMQAILSNAIVYIQSRISESNRNTMSWKDYFIRGRDFAIVSFL